jgi:excinuclease UvrABC ATPase subunit
MGDNNIWIRNIRTNNLKGFDIEIQKGKINCIIGPSGSGKSSLAFNTIYSICEHEYKLMVGDDDIYDYNVDDYGNILVGVALKQTNYNINKRSTIATYYSLDRLLKFIYASENNIASDVFSFNKYSSSCKKCSGLGYIDVPDISTLIDYDLTIKEMPFIPWQNSSSRDLFRQLLHNTAIDMHIPINIPFRNLSIEQKEFLLNGVSNTKYKLNYSQSGRKRVKTDYYKGIVKYIQTECEEKSNLLQYTKEAVCPECGGTRFDKKINKYKILDTNIGQLYLMEFSELLTWLKEFKDKYHSKINIDTLINFVANCNEMKLGHLFLNRAIPSLSGGEFQRLRLSQLLNSKFENLLFIIDEPLASLHILEKKYIVSKLEFMKNKNTLLLVEHNKEILPVCDNIIALGPSGGIRGGEIINSKDYLSKEEEVFDIKYIKSIENISIESTEYINNVKPFKIKLPVNTCIGIGGISGSGKTTFVREILPKHMANYTYISQKPIRGNTYSQISTYLNIQEKIRDLFAKVNKIESSVFSSSSNSSGACKTCHGTGRIIMEEYNKKTSYTCPICNGSRFNDYLLKYKYYDLNIIEIMNMEIDDACDFFNDKNDIIFAKLSSASKFGLGYLKLNQEISTLSGGEAQRIKLLRNIDTKNVDNVFALDEPFQGLNSVETFNIMSVLYTLAIKGNTILIVEHSILALKLCSYIVEFGIGSGKSGGDIVFLGKTKDIKTAKNSLLKKYL